MGVGGGIGDAAVDVTYSTKPDSQTLNTLNYGTGSYSTSSYEFSPVGVENVGLTTTGGNAVVNTTGNVMGFGAGGDSAIDVTYSTKPDNGVGLATGALTTTTTTTATTGNVMGFGSGGDNAIDVTYSTKPDNQTTTTVVNTQYNINSQNIEMYNKTTLLPDKVQHIVQKE